MLLMLRHKVAADRPLTPSGDLVHDPRRHPPQSPHRRGCPRLRTLIAHGIRRDDGKRVILGVSCALSEAEVQWRGFLAGLKERGIGIPDLVRSDAHSGQKAARKAPP